MGTIPCDPFHPLDPTEFSDESCTVIDFISDYYRSIEKYPVRSQVEPGYLTKLMPKQAPRFAEPIETILTDIKHDILPGLTHWQSPNFYAYFQANASTAGFLGEMLCSGLNVVGFNWISSPAATELESIVMDWMGKLLKLPNSFLFSGGQGGGGVLHGSTCEAVICTLVAARDHALHERGYDAITKLVVYASDQTHSTVQKAVKIVGIPPSNFRVIRTFASEGYAMKPSDLEDVLKDDVAKGFVPVYLVATVGTTGVGAIDPIRELGKLANEFGIWYHIDAAYGWSAVICPEFRHYFDGVELADSVSMNPHKWFLTNMDCCCLWIKNAKLLVDSLSTNPEFLRNQASETNEVVDYKDWQIALSRRFKAIKLWLVMRRFGVDNLVKHIRSDITMAKQFEKMVRMDNRFEVVVPRKFALICFRLKPKFGEDKDANGDNEKLLEMVNSSGKAFMTHVKVDGMYVLRFAVGTTLTELKHVKATWKLIQDKATEYQEKQIKKNDK